MAKSGAPLPEPPPTVALPPLPLCCIPHCCCRRFWGRRGGPRHKIVVVLGLGLHVVEAPPPHLGVRRCVAIHLERHDAEESVPILVNHSNVKGGGLCLDLRSRVKRASSLSAATPASLACPPGGQSAGGGGGHRPSATTGSSMEGRVFNQFRQRLGLSPRWSDPG